MKIDVAFLPADIKQTELAGRLCIVLDVFRATSSIVTAMANGCKTIIPVTNIEEAHQAATQVKDALFAGERQSIKIEGFDFGNSPFEFSADRVAGQTIIMTTTNGTNAIKATDAADITLIGSFINAAAVCRQAIRYGKDILIVCAGTDLLFSLEDALCAGLLVNLLRGEEEAVIMTDAAWGAWAMYNGAKQSIIDIVGNSRNGRRLYELGRVTDIEYCLRKDIINVVPRYAQGKIRTASSTERDKSPI